MASADDLNPTSKDDVYDDPDNILADDDDTVDGSVAAPANNDDLSQSIDLPEKNTTPFDDRGNIDELEGTEDNPTHDEMDPLYPEDAEPDSNHSANNVAPEENDGTNP